MKRREFLRNIGLSVGWFGVVVVLDGCSDEDDPGTPGSGGTGDVDGVIGANHGHVVTITGVQLDAGGSVILTLVGGTHTHSVTLTAQQVEAVAMGQRVSATSSSDSAHSHPVTFN